MWRLSKRDVILIKRVIKARNASFLQLVKLADLDPQVDFQYRDLSYLDFGKSDLRGFSFKGAVLDHSNLAQCVIDKTTDFSQSSTIKTLFPQGRKEKRKEGKKSYVVLFIEFDIFFVDLFKSFLKKPPYAVEIQRTTFDESAAAICIQYSRLSAEKKDSALICVDKSFFNVIDLDQKIPADELADIHPDVFYIWVQTKAPREGVVQSRFLSENSSGGTIDPKDRQVLDAVKAAIANTQTEISKL